MANTALGAGKEENVLATEIVELLKAMRRAEEQNFEKASRIQKK